jgi:hypothetical protein
MTCLAFISRTAMSADSVRQPLLGTWGDVRWLGYASVSALRR